MQVYPRALRSFARVILECTGLSEADAYTVADSLVFANLRGVDSHGIVRLAPYVDRLEAGGTATDPDVQIVTEGPAVALVNGDNGMGQVVSVFATDLAVTKAKETGVSFVGVNRSGHNGAASYYTHRMAEAGMIGVVTSNATPVMAAWGGVEAAIGNNPLSIGVPHREGPPIIFDAAMSKVAGGKVRLAAENDETIPEGWIVDEYGRPTTDPNDILDGALLPFGEHKGFALAVMVEILSAVVTGAGMLHQNPFWAKDLDAPLDVGHSFLAIDAARLIEPDEFARRLSWMVGSLRASGRTNGEDRVRMPGELEAETAERRRDHGIPVSTQVWTTLGGLSDRYDVALPDASETQRTE